MAAAANRGRSWETPAPRRTRASSRHLPSHTTPLMSFEPNLAAPEPRLLMWRLKNLRLGSGRQRQLSRPRVLPASLGPLPVGERHSSGKNSDSCGQPTLAFFLCQAFLSWQGFRQAVRFWDCRERSVNSGAAGVAGPQDWSPLDPVGRTCWAFISPHACPLQSKIAGPNPSFLSSSCGHLVLCLALPTVYRVKTFWPFLF